MIHLILLHWLTFYLEDVFIQNYLKMKNKILKQLS